MEMFYVWLIIVALFVGISIGFLVSHFSIGKAYSRLKREYKKYKADLEKTLDAHAKHELPISYDEVEYFLKEKRNKKY
jgi:uncharacterized membrane-anchored protein YhcB (DUF1043 family)